MDDYLALSVQYYKTHRFEESIAACEQALKIQPELAEAYSNEAASYYVLGKDEQAIHALREAIRIRPDMDIAKQNLAFLLSEQSKLAKQAAPH